jgi:hypothetical protein
MLKLNNRDTRNTIFAELLALSILSLKILALLGRFQYSDKEGGGVLKLMFFPFFWVISQVPKQTITLGLTLSLISSTTLSVNLSSAEFAPVHHNGPPYLDFCFRHITCDKQS